MSVERQVTIVAEREPVRVLVVAEVRLYREALAASLQEQSTLDVIGVASTIDDVLAAVAASAPDVIVVDVAMRNSLTMVRTIRERVPTSRVIAFAIEEVDHEILLYAEAGVVGYVSSECTLDDLVTTIECAARGELRCSPKTAAVLLRRVASASRMEAVESAVSVLTMREREIIGLIEQGLSNKEIAARLCIEVATVKNHVHNILEKLKVSTRGEAVARIRRETSGFSLRQSQVEPQFA
jgi:two-component system nitrate/nitrite response regulator NarL